MEGTIGPNWPMDCHPWRLKKAHQYRHCQSNPNVLYARYADANGSIQGSIELPMGWYLDGRQFGIIDQYWVSLVVSGIVIDPTDENTIYNVDFGGSKSTDGGTTWSNVFVNAHVDQHTLAFNTNVPGYCWAMMEDSLKARMPVPLGPKKRKAAHYTVLQNF